MPWLLAYGCGVASAMRADARLWGELTMSSGYRACACRDCMEIAIGEAGAYCNACEGVCGPEFSTSRECQADDVAEHERAESAREPGWTPEDLRELADCAFDDATHAAENLEASASPGDAQRWRDIADKAGRLHRDAERIVACVNALAGLDPAGVAGLIVLAENVEALSTQPALVANARSALAAVKGGA